MGPNAYSQGIWKARETDDFCLAGDESAIILLFEFLICTRVKRGYMMLPWLHGHPTFNRECKKMGLETRTLGFMTILNDRKQSTHEDLSK